MSPAASTGELERFADICHEYELPYRMGELEENATVARLAEEGLSAAVALRWCCLKRPLTKASCSPRPSLRFMATPTFSKRSRRPPQRARSRPKTASFFSDFSDLKPGDYVVHIDHGIGQFEGLRQVVVEGATGEFMLLRYAGDAKLYVPLARLDLVQKYQSLGGVGARPRSPGHHGVGSAQDARAQIRHDMAEQLLRSTPSAKPRPATHFPADTNWQRRIRGRF